MIPLLSTLKFHIKSFKKNKLYLPYMVVSDSVTAFVVLYAVTCDVNGLFVSKSKI